jgi:catechol 2,3-dioxygenase-like lactoylglutathione lyase family enzyme
MAGAPVAAVLRISRVVSDLARAEDFYAAAAGFRTLSRGPVDPAALRALGAGALQATEVVMRLGAEEIALVNFAQPGRPYPLQSRSDDLWFQHLALVAADMDAAYAQLQAVRAWQPISAGGPQTLPRAAGAVRAFKFRDPDGHPLEILWFPAGQGREVWHAARGNAGRAVLLGIDHSALAVRATRPSLAFYAGLGFHRSACSRNHGAAQSRLDGLARARLVVTGLRPAAAAGPGLELLAYRPAGRRAVATNLNDLAVDWVTLALTAPAPQAPRALMDPDGHRLLILAQRDGGSGSPAAGPAT